MNKKTIISSLFFFFVAISSVILAQESPFEYTRDIKETKDHEKQEIYPLLITASYTYWAPYQDRMTIADSTGSETVPGSAIVPHLSAQSGFKIGVGGNTLHNDWELFLEYTWFLHNPSMQTATFTTDLSYDILFTGNSSDELTSKFYNQFNLLTAAVLKTFIDNGYLSITPWFGLLVAQETQRVEYNDKDFIANGQYRFKQNWWGVGPYVGSDFAFFITDHCGFFFRLGTSFHLARHDVYYRVEEYFGTTLINTLYNLKEKYNDIEPMVESLFGLRADFPLKGCNLLLDIAWENQTYFSHNGFRPVPDSMYADGNYSMQGLTLTAGVNF